ncbi:MAG: family 16 glycosylhydrolase [Phycisphaerales bacterium]|nr:family 16 glycosylhydrolase [Phycisphaerales bacterium]
MMRSTKAFGMMVVLASGVFATRAHGQVLVWSDEFDGTTIDSANWGHMFGNGCEYGNCGWGNNELEYYTTTSNNSYVADGALHIVARREEYEGFQFTSARMQTRYRHNFLYGRLEANIKLPTGGGIWPAFWMMPADSVYGGWASSGEIDIMEMINTATKVYGTIHYGGNWPANQHSGGEYAPGTDFSQGFHVFGIEWEPDEIRWYVDGNLYHTETSATWYSSGATGNPRAPFDQPFYFLLNVAVGGNWPGCTQPGCITATFPQEMVIDWVRVYQIAPPEVSITSPTDGATLSAGPVTITATAAATAPGATIDRVDFYINDVLVGDDDTAPYEYAWDAEDGCYGLTATAIDSTGQTKDSDIVSVSVGIGCASPPYYGYPQVIPGKIEAEDFDLGGAGESYYDSTSGNSGGAYRPSEDVDLEACSDGGFNIGWMAPTEWTAYTVNVAQTGMYNIAASVSSQNDGGRFHIEFNGEDKTGDMIAPVTGGWQSWQLVNATAQLSPGVQQMRFVNSSDAGSYNVSFFNLTLLTPFGDIDLDGDVDLVDYALLAGCLSGPNQTGAPVGCLPAHFERADYDGDGDVDVQDFAVAQEILP